jgi:hypothetical protein
MAQVDQVREIDLKGIGRDSTHSPSFVTHSICPVPIQYGKLAYGVDSVNVGLIC